jgi:hypothetical protein
VQNVEPACLAKVRTLAGNLEGKILVGEGALVKVCVAENVLLIIDLNQVLDNGTGFPQGDVSIGVFDG